MVRPSGLTAIPRGRTSPGRPEMDMVPMTLSLVTSMTVMLAPYSLET
jgi:hypothetical protein